MGKTYTSTIEVACFKEHTCTCCGAVYSYNLQRTVKGTAATADKATANAQKAAALALEREVDLEPCPTCGLLQPDMIGQRRVGRHKTVFWVALIVFAAIIIMRAAYLIQADIAIWAAVAACAAAAVALWLTDTADPNRNPEANRQTAEGRVASGAVAHTAGKLAPGAQELARVPRSLVHKMTLAMLAIAVVMAAAPEVVRLARHWPLNSDCYPPVVGPGDQSRIYMTDKIDSIKGYWRGHPSVSLHEDGATASTAKAIPLQATTNQNDWGREISAKSSEKHSSSTPWVAVTMPDDPALGGKTMACDVVLGVEYPEVTGSSSFQTVASKMNRNLTLQLASTPGAGGSYNDWWWEGTVGGMAVLLVCALVLVGTSRALQRKARPTRLLSPTPRPVAAV
jgi:hypothetical protein